MLGKVEFGLSNKNGGLGVKDVRVVNVSLLAKWRWRLLDGVNTLWKEVIKEKYGPSFVSMVDGSEVAIPNNASLWWKDIARIDNFSVHGWFTSEVCRRVGNGCNTSFWNVHWRGDMCFRLKFPRLFSLSNQKEASIGDLFVLNGSIREWFFVWRRQLFVWEEQLVEELLEDLVGVTWRIEEDRWRWNLEEGGAFSVKSAYLKLERLILTEDSWSHESKRVFSRLWKSPAPSKVLAFSWKVFHKRLPTRDNLRFRNVLTAEVPISCVMCDSEVETAHHLFLHCEVATNVWKAIMRWFDCSFLMPSDFFIHWECWSGMERNKKIRKGLWLVWNTSIWVIWRARNDKIFNNLNWEVGEIIEEIQVLSWCWLLSRIKTSVCMLYEWKWNPKDCLLRRLLRLLLLLSVLVHQL